jgi:hypothetical protein
MTVATMVRGPATRAGSAARSRGASRSTKCPPPAVGATGPGNRRLCGWSSRPWRKAHRPSLPKQATTIKEFSDLVVIGSGLGTVSPVAVWPRLGARSAFLSEGRRWNSTDFRRSPSRVVRSAVRTAASGRDGVLQDRAFQHVYVIQGCDVRGSSLHYFKRAPAPAWRGSDRRAVVQWRSRLGHGRGAPWRRTVTRSWPMTRLVSE